jgi:hypothetical protein
MSQPKLQFTCERNQTQTSSAEITQRSSSGKPSAGGDWEEELDLSGDAAAAAADTIERLTRLSVTASLTIWKSLDDHVDEGEDDDNDCAAAAAAAAAIAELRWLRAAFTADASCLNFGGAKGSRACTSQR